MHFINLLYNCDIFINILAVDLKDKKELDKDRNDNLG